MADGNGTGPVLTADQLRALSTDLRTGDVWRGGLAYPDDPKSAGMAAFVFAAARAGLVADPGPDVATGVAAFLDRVLLSDFEAVLADRRPLPTAGAGLPVSVGTGE